VAVIVTAIVLMKGRNHKRRRMKVFEIDF